MRPARLSTTLGATALLLLLTVPTSVTLPVEGLPADDPPADGGEVELRLSVYRRTAEGAQVETPAGHVFRGGDQVRFGASASAAGRLYLLLQGSSGQTTIIYPDARIAGGSHRIEADLQVVIPADDWFAFDTTPGTETIHAIFAPESQGGGVEDRVPQEGMIHGSKIQALLHQSRAIQRVTDDDEPDAVAPSTIFGENVVVASLALRHE